MARVKQKSKRISVYLLEHDDQDIIEALSGKNASEFIREAVRAHIGKGGSKSSDSEIMKKLTLIEKKLEKLSKGMIIALTQSEPGKETNSEIEQIENGLLDAWK